MYANTRDFESSHAGRDRNRNVDGGGGGDDRDAAMPRLNNYRTCSDATTTTINLADKRRGR